eukprot:GILI01000015.1.p2 GENE.GILI01000015.1~~GILI01000015.1.p2  ORF type:complete len:262 (+),score=78.78 GILI01000015.1:85-786(+)
MATAVGDNVKFLAFGRATDHAALCTFVHGRASEQHSADFERVFGKLLQVAKSQVSVGQRGRNSSELGTLFFLIDKNECVFATVVNASYPERQAFAMIEEMINKVTTSYEREVLNAPVNGLAGKAKKMLKELATKYDDLTQIDKMHQVMSRVDNVKDIMQDNVKKILQTHENLETLEGKTDQLRVHASQFQSNATELKRQMYWKALKMKLLIAAIVIIVFLCIFVPIIVSHTNK